MNKLEIAKQYVRENEKMDNLTWEEKEIVKNNKDLIIKSLKKVCDKHTREEIKPSGVPFEVDVFYIGKYKIYIKFDWLEYIYNEKSLYSIEILNIDKINITDKSIVFHCKNRTQRYWNKCCYKKIIRRKENGKI